MAIQYSQQSTTAIPSWMEAATQQLQETVGGTYNPEGELTKPGLMQDPYQTYNQANPSAPRVVNQDNAQIDAYMAATNPGVDGIGGYKPYMDAAGTNVGAATGIITDSSAQGYADKAAGTGIDSLNQFRNPYQQQVMNATMQEMNRQHSMDVNKLNAAAAQSDAYGGSRHGVATAEMARNNAFNRANMIAKLNAQGFQSANDMNQQYLNRNLQSGQLSNQIDATGTQTNLEAGRLNTAMAGQGQTLATNDINMGAQFGDRAQQYNQTVRDANVQEYYEGEMKPYQMAGFYSDILQGVPSSQSSLTTASAPDPSKLSQGIGALGTYASIGNDFGWWGSKDGGK